MWTPEWNPLGIPWLWSGFFPCVSFHGSLSETTGRREQRVKGLGLVLQRCSVLLLWSRGSATDLLMWFFFSSSSLVYLEGEGPSVPGVRTPHVNAWCWGARGPKQKGLCWTFLTAGLTLDHEPRFKQSLWSFFVDMFCFSCFVLIFYLFKYTDPQRNKSANMLSTIIRWDLSQPQVQHWWKMAEFAAESVFKCIRWLTVTICLVSLFQEHNNSSAGVSDLQRRMSRQRLEVNTAKVVTHTVRKNSHKVGNNVFCSRGSWLQWLTLRKSNHILALLPAWTCNMWHYRWIFDFLFFSREAKTPPQTRFGPVLNIPMFPFQWLTPCGHLLTLHNFILYYFLN